MACIIKIKDSRWRKKKHRIYGTSKYQQKTGIRQKPFSECVWEFLSAIFIFLIVLSVLAGIACLLN